MAIPRKPRNITDGALGAVVHDEPADKDVLAVIVGQDDALIAQITAGSPYFRLRDFWVADLEIEQSDEGPPGHPHLVWWNETKVADFDGVTPLKVSEGQRIHADVSLAVPDGTLLPGPVTGTLTVSGAAFSSTLNLAGTYIAVDPRTAIGQKWRNMGGEAFFGRPINNEHWDDKGPGLAQDFANGTLIEISGHGVFYFSPQVTSLWRAGTTSGDIVRDAVGLPLEDTITRSDGVQVQRFESGAIVVRNDGTARAIFGAIYQDYLRFPGELANPSAQPFPGLPLEDEQIIVDGRSQRFDNCDYFWTPLSGAHEIHGDIRQHWYDLGGAGSRGFLGFPVTDETGTPDGVGRFNRFQNGMIYWTPQTGAREVHGAILERWSALGFERSRLGYPVSDEQPWQNPNTGQPGRVSFFQNGHIGWTPQDGAIEFPPESISFSQQVLTPSGTALGGTVSVTLRSDGTYNFTGHMHDSGFDSYSFRVRAVVRSASGVALAAQHSGHTAGTLGSGSRDDDWNESGYNPWIRQHWPELRSASMNVSKSYEDTGVLGTVEDIAKDFVSFLLTDVLFGPELALVIAIGEEVTTIAGSSLAGPGGLPGVAVAGGVVWIFGPGAVVAATVAGVAAGAVVDAMITHRSPTGEEMKFASQVFGDTLPQAGRIVLTNLTHDGGRKYTWPMADGSVMVNLGDAYGDPVNYQEPGYPMRGQVFIHELTHAWQITRTSFLPGLICQGALGKKDYDYGSPGPVWSSFGLEQQGAIVDQWFGGNRDSTNHVPGTGVQMDVNDLYFGYISNNIRLGEF